MSPGFTWAETSLRLVSPFPQGWSIADELTIRSSRPKLSLTRSAAPRTSSSRVTSRRRTVTFPGCWLASPRSSAAPSGLRHVAITAAGFLLFKICLQNWSPNPLLAPWISATGAAMTANDITVEVNEEEECLLHSGSPKILVIWNLKEN